MKYALIFLSLYFSCWSMQQLSLFDPLGTISKKSLMALAQTYKEPNSYNWNNWDDIPKPFQQTITQRYYAYKYVLYKNFCTTHSIPEDTIISVLQFMKYPYANMNTNTYNCRTFPFAQIQNIKFYLPELCLVQDVCNTLQTDIQEYIASLFSADRYILPILWQIHSYRPIATWKAHESAINNLRLIDTDRCATIANDGYMKVWNLKTQQLLARCDHYNPVQLLDHMLDILVTTTSNNKIWFWHKDTYELLLTKEYDKPIIDLCSTAFNTFIILEPIFFHGFAANENKQIFSAEKISTISTPQISVTSITAFSGGFVVIYKDAVVCFLFQNIPLLELKLPKKTHVIKSYSVGCFFITFDTSKTLRIYLLHDSKLKHIRAFRIYKDDFIPHCIGIDSHLVVNTHNKIHFLADHKDYSIETKVPTTALAEIDTTSFISGHADGSVQKWIPICTQENLSLPELFLISKLLKQ